MHVAIRLLDDGPGDPARTRELAVAHAPAGVPFVDSEDEAGDRDVVLVRAGCLVGRGWIEGLAAAAGTDSIAATASPVVGDEPSAGGAASPPARIRRPGPACFYVRRTALQAAGPLDDGFAERCLALGLQHLLTGDVVVGWPQPRTAAHDRLEAAARVERAAALRSRRLSITVDGRCLGDRITGTQVHALELIGALRRHADLQLRVLVPDAVGAHARQVLDGVECLAYDDLRAGLARTDVVHRPYQVTAAEDLGVLSLTGERVVITHQDLIAYRNPAYHPNLEGWESHRRHTREALALSDLVVFESDHAAADALADDLVETGRVRVVPIGTDHRVVPAAAPERPRGAPEAPFLLCLGADYLHKHRVFAMRIVAALRERHGWEGQLVLAGPIAEHGSAALLERAWLDEHPEVPVTDLGPVSEAEKRWLYESAVAVAYPTTYEGFGLIPFEAAAHGTPCLWAPVASLGDVLPEELALLVPWDAEASADRAIEVLGAPQEHVAAVREAARAYTWERTVRELVAVYAEAAVLPARIAAVVAADALTSENARTEWEGRYWALRQDIGPIGMFLVGPDHPLLPEDARSVLAGLLRRPATRRATLAALRGLGRLR